MFDSCILDRVMHTEYDIKLSRSGIHCHLSRYGLEFLGINPANVRNELYQTGNYVLNERVELFHNKTTMIPIIVPCRDYDCLEIDSKFASYFLGKNRVPILDTGDCGQSPIIAPICHPERPSRTLNVHVIRTRPHVHVTPEIYNQKFTHALIDCDPFLLRLDVKLGVKNEVHVDATEYLALDGIIRERVNVMFVRLGVK